MNLSLQDPFSVAKEYPDTLVQTLQYGHSVCISFNRKGDYLASGLSDGTVIIYDLLSYAIICVLRKDGHVRPITSLTWSHCGRYILSSSQDWSCILWDLQYANSSDASVARSIPAAAMKNPAMQNPAILQKIRFGSPIWSACLHPRNPFIFSASLYEDSPVYVKIGDAQAAGESEGNQSRGAEAGGEEPGGQETGTEAEGQEIGTEKEGQETGTEKEGQETGTEKEGQETGTEKEGQETGTEPKSEAKGTETKDADSAETHQKPSKDNLPETGGGQSNSVRKFILPTDPKVAEEDEGGDKKSKHQTLVTIFTISGDYLICGTSKGWLNVIDAQTIRTVHSVKVANCNIKSLVMSPNGRKLAVNCSDRIIRQIHLPDFINNKNPEQWEFDVEHRYQDVVNRLQWNGVTFNANSEFLVASTFGQSSQDLYVWETGMGSLIKILEGSQEELIDVKWNYNKCMIGSTGLDTGTVYLWSIQFPSKWSALAPDFVEIEENEEYQERENEFDFLDETEVIKKRMEEEDLEIDILSNEQTDVRGFDTQITSFVIPINYESSVVKV